MADKTVEQYDAEIAEYEAELAKLKAEREALFTPKAEYPKHIQVPVPEPEQTGKTVTIVVNSADEEKAALEPAKKPEAEPEPYSDPYVKSKE